MTLFISLFLGKLLTEREGEQALTNLQIEYFLSVAATKSISKTAADLFVSSPAVSKQIALMEQELGFALFIRSARGMELTMEGQIMYDYYMTQKRSLEHTMQRIQNLTANLSNTLHLGIMSGWGIIPQIMAMQKHLKGSGVPTSLVPHSVFDPGNPQRLEKGIFDAALCIGDDLFTTALSTMVHMVPLTKIRKIILFSSFLPLSKKEDLCPANLAQLPLITFSTDVRPNAQYDNLRLCSKLGFNPQLIPKGSLEDAFLTAAIGQGFMIGDEWLYQRKLPEFSCLTLEDTHTIYLIWSEQNRNPALPILEEICKKQIDWSAADYRPDSKK